MTEEKKSASPKSAEKSSTRKRTTGSRSAAGSRANGSRVAGRRRAARKRVPRKGALRRWILWIVILLVCGAAAALWHFGPVLGGYKGEKSAWVYVSQGATQKQIADSLRASLGDEFGSEVAKCLQGSVAKSRGAYQVKPGERAFKVARRILQGRQTPIRLTFNNIRTVDDLDARLSGVMGWKEGEFGKAFAAMADALQVAPQMLAGRMMPDTYEVYWTASPRSVIEKVLKNYERFWTDERKSQAQALGLSPDEVGIVASIAEEESARADERGKIARLYINRLRKGMRLQADPTVKFAVGDFSIRRVGGDMLGIDSPYNTYRRAGLPPAPIRIPDKATLEAVLTAPAHDYIYMCASADFSGRHIFTASYAEHQRNAAAYRAALNARGIK